MDATATRRLKHWGWGYEDQQPPREQVEGIARAVTDRLGFEVDEIEEPVPLDAVELPEPRIKPPKRFAEMFSSDRYDRVAHSLGKAYRDVVRGFRGEFPNPPDLVAYPESAEDVDIVLNYCADEKAAAIPYGGGTSVVGGIEPRMREDYPGVVSIDLKRMDRVLEVDAVSKSARIQAGASGPQLEEQLREHGLTLRHFPQSFEYSTLGGWIATRAGGHFAMLETHIDDLVESVRAVTLDDEWESRRLPGSGAGPSPDRMLIGSEGILGVIVDAWVRVRERPTEKISCGVAYDDFMAGAEAVREISQSGLNPSNCRLLDAVESDTTSAGTARQGAAGARLRVGAHPGRGADVAGAGHLPRSRRRAGRAEAERRRRRRARRPAASRRPRLRRGRTRSTPGATPSSTRPTCGTRWSPAASSRTPSRRRSPGTSSRTSTPR